MADLCLQVCVLCGEAAGGEPTAGRRLFEALQAAAAGHPDIDVAAAECFAVCDRPVTLAFQAAERWSYIVGDVGEQDLPDILAAARAAAQSPHGVPAMDDRPPFFRKGVIARLPPARAPGRKPER